VPKKPSGEVGTVRLQVGNQTVTLEWDKVKFPIEKDALERRIMESFVRAGGKVFSLSR
jgi:hypothetical protein